MKKVITAGTRINRDQIKIALCDYLISTYEAEIDGEMFSDVYDRIINAVKQGFSFEQLETWANSEGITLVEALNDYENGNVVEDDEYEFEGYKGTSMASLKTLYNDRIAKDKFPTFEDWIDSLDSQDLL